MKDTKSPATPEEQSRQILQELLDSFENKKPLKEVFDKITPEFLSTPEGMYCVQYILDFTHAQSPQDEELLNELKQSANFAVNSLRLS